MRKLALALALFLQSFAAWTAGADVTGKWTGTFVMDGAKDGARESAVILNLKQDGSVLSGTAGPTEDQQWPVEKGRVEGDRGHLEVQSSGPLLKFDLALASDHLKGDAHISANGQELSAKVDAQRAR